MSKKVKIKIVDYYAKLYQTIEEIIMPEYELEISDHPDFLIYGPYGTGLEHYKYNNCIKICWCAEGIVPDFNECDYGIGSFPMSVYDNRYLRVPYCAPSDEIMKRAICRTDATNRKFCNFVYSNETRGEGAVLRKLFCKELMKYKQVDCPGNVLHNMDGDISGRGETGWVRSKINFVSNYKFTIAFENVKQYGMISEKIMTAFQGESVPIYWGAPDVSDIYNERSFLNLSGIDSIQEMVDRVIELDQDDSKYYQMLNSCPVSDSFDWNWKLKRKEWFLNILENGTSINPDPLAYDSGRLSAQKIIKASRNPVYRTQEYLDGLIEKIRKRI
jgi:hypothetical protein